MASPQLSQCDLPGDANLSNYVTVARLLYPLLSLDEFARLCLTCSSLQAFARSHSAFQEAALGSRILWLTRQLDQQPYGKQGVFTMTCSLRSHCLGLLLSERLQDRPWRGEDLERLVLVYDMILRQA